MTLRSIAVAVLSIASVLGFGACDQIHVESHGYGTYYQPGGQSTS